MDSCKEWTEALLVAAKGWVPVGMGDGSEEGEGEPASAGIQAAVRIA